LTGIKKNIAIEVFFLLLFAFLPIWLQFFLNVFNPETYENLPTINEIFWAIVVSSFTFFSTTFIKFYPQRSVDKIGLLIVSGICIFLLALVSSTFFLPKSSINIFSGAFYIFVFIVIFSTSIWASYIEWTGKESPVVASHEQSTEDLGDELEELRARGPK